MVGAAGFEPARPCGQWILSPWRLSKFRHAPAASARTTPTLSPSSCQCPMIHTAVGLRRMELDWRRRADSNRRITDLQSAALPLGYGAVRRSDAAFYDTYELPATDAASRATPCDR